MPRVAPRVRRSPAFLAPPQPEPLAACDFAYLLPVGQRSSTETLFSIVAAFIERRTWSQADLARRLSTRPETVRRHLTELQAAGLSIERQEEHPHVYWSVPRQWFPGALVFKADEAAELLRLIARAPRSALKSRVIKMVASRLSSLGDKHLTIVDSEVIQPAEISPDEEKWLGVLEDAAQQKVAVNMRYYSASRGHVRRRHASVHRVDVGPRPQFIATCHEAGELRRFRVDNVLDARLDRAEPFRATTAAALTRFDRESFGGFRDVGPVVDCAFFVRDPEASWVAKNLPDPNISHSVVSGGARFRVQTAGVVVLARFVAGLGEVAKPETPELAQEVAAIARAALKNATT